MNLTVPSEQRTMADRQPVPVAFDEYGRPFIILREQAEKRRVTGLNAQKVRRV